MTQLKPRKFHQGLIRENKLCSFIRIIHLSRLRKEQKYVVSGFTSQEEKHHQSHRCPEMLARLTRDRSSLEINFDTQIWPL